MTLASFTVELRRTNDLLERLCKAVEYGVGLTPIPRPEPTRKVGLDDVSRISNAATLQREMDEEMARRNPGRGGIAVDE